MASRKSGGTSFKSQIVKLRQEQPGMTYRQIADKIGCDRTTVAVVCRETGLQSGRQNQSREADYRRVREEHPEWTAHQIAKYLGVNSGTTYRWQKRLEPDRQRIAELGAAAARAGLTLQQIEAMGNARHA